MSPLYYAISLWMVRHNNSFNPISSCRLRHRLFILRTSIYYQFPKTAVPTENLPPLLKIGCARVLSQPNLINHNEQQLRTENLHREAYRPRQVIIFAVGERPRLDVRLLQVEKSRGAGIARMTVHKPSPLSVGSPTNTYPQLVGTYLLNLYDHYRRVVVEEWSGAQ